ncbi:S41 family peptidase [Neptunitalea lumnitzerae]|nr:S41 family peptidase [Neptunitalea sp. Y10]
MRQFFFSILGISFLFVSCNDRDDNIQTYTSSASVEDFIWKGLNFWYFWQAEVEDLDDNRFASSQEYSNFITSFASPDMLFYNLCNQHTAIYDDANTIDRFSYITDDYTSLVNSLSGSYTTNGVEFGLAQFSDSNDIYGFVKYIMTNSNASTKNIHRGDIFTGVNGIQLTLDNYNDLLYGNTSYTLNMASIVNASLVTDFHPQRAAISENGVTVDLTKESYTENPVFKVATFSNAGHTIGYLMYNGFTADFNTELNNAFAQLKGANVTDLVIDFRYNGGGSVNTSRILSSLITGQFTGDLYIKQRWNDKIQSQLSDAELSDYFTNTNSDGASLNSLQLSEVYVLTTYQTASASELVINALDPYITVHQIGASTRGKNEFSITLVDDPGNSYIYSDNRINYINTNNSWGMQPLVGRNANAAGFYDYADTGFIPDTQMAEDLTNMGILGNETEPFLAEAIAQITGSARKAYQPIKISLKEFANSKSYIKPFNNMYVEKTPDIHISDISFPND